MAALSGPLRRAVASAGAGAGKITASARFGCASPSVAASSSVAKNIALQRAIATQTPPTVPHLDGLAGACGTARPLMRLVNMSGVPILQQLQLEEYLLRCTTDNWCIINDGTAPPAIVMGSRGGVLELVEIQSVLRDRVPVVRRFSTGGTVVVNHGTVFVTLICNRSAVPGPNAFAPDILSWSRQIYGKVFDRFGEFHLRENDYVFSCRKFGGNAQCVTKNRCLHHTSFLWDYDVKNMDYLKIPKRAPEYRLARSHTDFLCRMKDYIPSRSFFTDGVVTALGGCFSVEPAELEEVLSYSEAYVPRSELISQEDLEATLSSEETA